MIGENDNEIKKLMLISGVFGILSFITIPITMVLYFMYPDVPPIWNVLTRTLLSVVALVFIIVFFTGLQHYVNATSKKYKWLMAIIYNTVCIFLATNFVAHSLEAGGVLNPAGIAVDATQVGILAQGNYLLYGSIGRLLTATFMLGVGILILKTNIFIKFIGWLAVIIGIINALFIPSMYFGTNNGDFYSVAGWGNSAVAASLYVYWILIVSIILIKKSCKKD